MNTQQNKAIHASNKNSGSYMGRPKTELDKESGKKDPGVKFKVTSKNREGLKNAKKMMSKPYVPGKQSTADGFMPRKNK